MKMLLSVLFALLVGMLTPPGHGANSESTTTELLVVEQDGCAYCERFRREIAEAYPKTDQGALAPLRWLDLHESWPPPYASLSPTAVTPTFILMSDGREIDRMYGYPGDEHFWFLLQQMLDKLDKAD